MPTPIIVDANSLITRCIMATALDDLQHNGIFTGGVYGSLSLLRSILSLPDIFPDGVYAFFDCGVPPHRRELLPDYKKKRHERKEKLTEEEKERAFGQMHEARLLFEKLGVTCLAYRDREADDCVAAAVRVFAETSRKESVVITSDKDLWQVVNMGAVVWDLSKNEFIDSEAVEEYTRVPSDYYVLYKALVGDPSDGIAGVRGVGPKKAADLIETHLLHSEEGHRTVDPADQWGLLLMALRLLDEPKKVEQAVMEADDYLYGVIEAIRLDNSFGGTTGLSSRLHTPAEVKRLDFLQQCRNLGFRSVLGSPNKYLRPFEVAARTRSFMRE